ncbi:hypothetical protein OJ997_18450 [Solirubrobacter phytolaccae]|uniref:Uncharacterized protein n=1 Tax=Solirubrobacter phytolaccae TaxID=1404360 RepID=A0A9X3NA25_9ACTN|nr:hypothetical protein [Solirubrobacter phytolaccae]MDA0182294.1 hypothetical protein [Solirubrobacter phytolaccae]
MHAPSVPVSKLGRAAHDVGMAGLLGGNLFARLALHPSVTEIRDESERGKVINTAWRRYGTINSLSLAAIGAGWVGARAAESANSRLSPTERKLAYAKDALVGAVAVTGIASAVQGMRFAKQAPGGAVPLTDGDHAAPSATDQQRNAKRRLNVLGAASLLAEVGLVSVNAALAQENFRRPPARRFFKRV